MECQMNQMALEVVQVELHELVGLLVVLSNMVSKLMGILTDSRDFNSPRPAIVIEGLEESDFFKSLLVVFAFVEEHLVSRGIGRPLCHFLSDHEELHLILYYVA